MVNKLKEIALVAGFSNMKDLSSQSNVPYTTVMNYCKTSIDTWNSENVAKLAFTLSLDPNALEKKLREPITLPFIKWVGGKRQLLPELIKLVPNDFGTYFEPFIGGGALLFKLSPQKAVINDFNEELTNTWQVVKEHYDELVTRLHEHEQNDSKDYYMAIRSVDRNGEIIKMSDVDRAARFIYLNKAGYNGLWRVNQKGQNNVPYGSHKHLNLVPDFLKDDSEYLSKHHIEIDNGDYKESINKAKKGDFIYLDPPYIPLNPTSSFTSYTKNAFGLAQQQELAETAKKYAQKGVKVMLSNADVPLISELYDQDVFTIHHVQANRAVNSKGNKRGKVGEVIITSNNY